MARDTKKLGTYHGKRAPSVTSEPFGGELALGPADAASAEVGAFVVHLHDATRRHFDLRLEVGGVLASFAVPHGPSLDPQKKVLAMKTEDHPIEYLDFEDVIPEGEYGAGPMIVWDRGLVRWLEGPPDAEIDAGKIHVELRGMKLRGRWALVKLAKSAKGNEWLLFKKEDEASSASRTIVDELPRSVLSGLTVEELERRDAIARALVEQARRLGAKKDGTILAGLLERDRAPLIVPAAGRRSGASSPVLYDADLEGVRVLAVRDGDLVALRTWPAESRGDCQSIEAFYPDVVRALRALPIEGVALDGDLVAFDATGRPSLPLLARRIEQLQRGETLRAVTATPVQLVVKDVLAIDGLDTRPLPTVARRSLVTALVPELGYLRAATALEADEAHVLASCTALGIAAVVAKPKDAPYDAEKAAWTLLQTGAAPRSRATVDHGAASAQTALRQVVVSNREKIFWPAEPPVRAYTKGDLVDYYAAVADVLCPFLKGRAVILVRYPDGIDGKSFFQWRVPVGMPPWIRTLTIRDAEDERVKSGEKTPKRGFLVDDPSTLVYVANLGCIPLHVLASRTPDLTQADFFTIDFDVKQSELRHAITLAQTLKRLLDAIGLAGYPKTSGQTGLHVLIPLGRGQTFDTARALADLLGRLLVEQHPDIATMERVVSRRGPRVYVDTGQTGTSRAIVAPYSVRAVPGATVSTPLSWDEVVPELDPRAFTMATVPQRLARRGDLLAGLLAERPDVAAAVAKLAEVVPRSVRPRSRDRGA